MSFFNKLFGRRSRGFNPFRSRSRRIADTLNAHRGGIALGTAAALAAPFVIRELIARRAARADTGIATAY